MMVSVRGRYGLGAMCELARRFGDGPVLMSILAEGQGVSRKHLHALLTSLKSAGLVESVRGPGGGFVLARPPGRIRLSEILLTVEGPLSLVQCEAEGRACDEASRCAARQAWQELSDAIVDVFDNVTLEDMTAPEAKECRGPLDKKKERRSRKRTRG